MVALGADGNPRAWSSAVMSPGGDPRIESVLFKEASLLKDAGEPLKPPDACIEPASSEPKMPRSDTRSSQRAWMSRTKASAAEWATREFAPAPPAFGRAAVPL